jgi:hypothetical protein
MQCSFLLFRSGTHHLLRNERFFERVVLSAQQATPLLRARSVRCQRSSSGTGEAILRRNMLGLLEISMLSAVRQRAPTPYRNCTDNAKHPPKDGAGSEIAFLCGAIFIRLASTLASASAAGTTYSIRSRRGRLRRTRQKLYRRCLGTRMSG